MTHRLAILFWCCCAGIAAANLADEERSALRRGAAENLKRVRIERFADGEFYDLDTCHAPWRIEPFIEIKTIWHPSAV